MATTPLFRLVLREGVDTVHGEYSHEECNLDDATKRAVVDEATARALVESGQAHICQHCRPMDPQTLNTRSDAP